MGEFDMVDVVGIRTSMRRGLTIAIVLSALVASLVAAPIEVRAQTPSGECPEILQSDQVSKGMNGIGYTVSEGTEPQPFDVEVLGVLPDGIAPGRDMILVETSSPAIEKAGGVWFGMSGSPVYVGGKLIGAVAYGLGFGPSKIAGLTAAQDLVALAERPGAGSDTAPRKVKLSSRAVKTIARATGRSAAQTDDSMRLLKSPLSVSGVGARALRLVSEAVERQDLGFIPYIGTSAAATPGPSASGPEPGGNFAAAFSYGDVTSAGIGTTSYVCDGKAVAFGHPFFFYPAGSTSLGSNSADAVAVIDDKVFGPFKVANVTGSYGLVDQDRFAGVRALLGMPVPTTPITSDIATDDGLSQRSGQTDVVDEDFLPFGTFIHVLVNADVVRDEISEGVADLTWTFEGTREDGSTWTYNRSNMFSNDYDISIESLFELQRNLSQILFNQFEEVKVTNVDVEGSYGTEAEHYSIDKVLLLKKGEYVDKEVVRASPGEVISLRVVLLPHEGAAEVHHDLDVVVPSSARADHFINISGGPTGRRGGYYGGGSCFLGGLCRQTSPKKVSSFDDLLARLQSTPRNNELVTTMRGARGKTKSEVAFPFDQVVRGFDSLYVIVRGTCCSDGGASPPDAGRPAT